MKRLLAAAFCLLLLPAAALAFDAAQHGDRVGVLRSPYQENAGHNGAIASSVFRYLVGELRERHLDAFDAGVTYDDVVAHGRGEARADYYVEIVSGDGYADPEGGVDIGGRDGGVELSVVVSHVAARLRIYDGETLELLDDVDLQHQNTAVMPTSIGVGGRHFGAWIALPFLEWMQLRGASRAVARKAAIQVASTVKP
ncbi:MAG TPA: hypothetical protein VFN10_03840 [Thermoanaerobaculia bacterium]|nr:hypothetical protein [Thermoanaerobaculia bacterium]